MLEPFNKNFAIFIAFILPGFMFLLALMLVQERESVEWAYQADRLDKVGSLIVLILASSAAGIILSAIRWAILDNIHHVTGLEAPQLDFRNLELRHASFMLVVENNYRYYLFYGNTLIGLVLVGLSAAFEGSHFSTLHYLRWSALCVILFFASRDALNRYYTRSRMIMGEAPPPKRFRRRRYS